MRISGFYRLPEGGSDERFHHESRDGEIEDFVGIKCAKSIRDRSGILGKSTCTLNQVFNFIKFYESSLILTSNFL